MNFDSYLAGIGQEGLKDIYEVKILICYLIYMVDFPLSRDEVNTVFQENGFVNYFKFAQAEKELLELGHLKLTDSPEGKKVYELGPMGIDTAQKLQTGLPRSLREQVVRAAMDLRTRLRREQGVIAQVEKAPDGYMVSCAIHDTGSDLMSFRVFVPDRAQADMVKEQFSRHPAGIYQAMIGLLTGNPELLEEARQKLANPGNEERF